MSAAHVLDALVRLEGMAVAGLPPDDVAHEAELIAAGWWWDGRGDLGPDRLVPLVQELRRWCVVASSRHAVRWDRLHRTGRPLDAREAARWAGALDRAQRALMVYAWKAPTSPLLQRLSRVPPDPLQLIDGGQDA